MIYSFLSPIKYDNISAPDICDMDLDDNLEALALYEWLGAMSCHLDL